MMKNAMWTLAMILGVVSLAVAQNQDRPWGITATIGKSTYNGDRGNAIFDFEQPFQGMGGLRLSRYINSSFDVSLGGTYGRHGYWESGNDFLSDMLHVNVLAHYKLLSEDRALRPMINFGIGAANYADVDERAEAETNFTVPVGLGAKWAMNDLIDLFWMSNYGINFGDSYDQDESEDGNDGHLNHQLGVTFKIGKTVDTDGDGIADKKDKCPMIRGVVELMGCPDSDGDGITDTEDACPNAAGLAIYDGCPDSDGDGIIDSKDRCPNSPGAADQNGCPDRDGDGVVDSEDDCPDVKGTAKLRGCPDSDNDGITDNADDCPRIGGSAKAKGCPDRDNDGIKDSEDDCPDTYGVIRFQGCPDTDGDGIMDKEDNCPTVKGLASNKGCPELSMETQQVFQEALRGINFETSKAIIKSSSYSILEKVVRVMNDNPAYKLSIEGHTDSQGNDDFNLKLSQDRAAAVKAYLVEKGIKPGRMVAIGFGETKPVADNNTPAGRALNRRVEFKVNF